MARPTGPDGPRSAVISIRLTPKLRFGLEMLSRLHRESLPDIISRAINDALSSEQNGLWDYAPGETQHPRMLMNLLWAERPSDRLANTALHCPYLLTAAENRLWALIKSKPELWLHPDERRAETLNREALAMTWDSLREDADMPRTVMGASKG